MADLEFGAFDASGTPQQGSFSRLMNLVGAGSSVVLVLGLAVWGYQLTTRDVTDVPVIRALEGPARVQPTDPGGQLAQHTGLAVNSVQSEGEAEGPTPQVILAPAPIDLTQEDAIVPSTNEIEVDAEGVVEEAVGTMVSLTQEINTDDAVEQALALADRLADGVEPLDDTSPAEEQVAMNLARPILDPKIPGVSRSPVPARKPQIDLAALQAQAAVASASAAVGGDTVQEIDPNTIASGTRLVQLGAFDDAETARAEWEKIAVRFEDYIDGKSRVIQEATSGGRKFYRLRAVGFEDLNASRRFCAVLVAGKAACIPVLAR
ncbi:SPOR domain-containing protein [Litoreibacter janthinus]|uniref:Sporulation related domain-containing protein n=1 Tax=Litoreibacter janthinus TaxID=670154 RepID=A0A1I6GQA8_9RHOB|nr:SPOR domain-containing protein [Litoreibacter janthinus]SFR44281.1 Sporulation related domain-containing protein [Litoreibacter janthinus]